MSKIDYVIRKEGYSDLICAESEWDFLVTEDILQNYPYILNSMAKEEYYIENEICTFFDEIIFENKVVGFATFQTRFDDTLLMSECFILPEFRGNRLFFNEICKMLFVNSKFGILQPTRNIVELLISYAFAKNFTENIVVSAIEFYFDDFDAKSSKNRELDEDEMNPSNFYDLSINSTVFVEGDEIIYHDLLENDLLKNGERKKLDENYFNDLKLVFSKNKDKLNELIIELKQELPKVEFGFNEIIGRGEGLSEFMQSMVDGDLLTYDEALGLKKQLTEEYDSGEITDDNIEQRIVYLLSDDELPFEDFTQFRELVDDTPIDDEEADVIKDFINVIGENEELGNDIVQALLRNDDEAFHNAIMGAMANDESFMNNFIDLANQYGGHENEFFLEDDQFDLLNDFEYSGYKLDDTQYGTDYPISYDREIYHILDSLNSDANYSMILNFIESEISSKNMLTEVMLNSQLIKTEDDVIDWVNSASMFKKDELKDLLRENGLKVSGNKYELLKRLADNNVPYGETFKITEKGKNYLKEFSWIEFYEDFLNDFDFDDFYRYLENHKGNLKEISLKYLDEHIALARQEDNEEYLENCILTKKIIQEDADEYIRDLNIPE